MSPYRVVGVSGIVGRGDLRVPRRHGLLTEGPRRAVRLLEDFWADNSAVAPHDRVMNAWMVWASRLQDYVVSPALSPYDNPWSDVGLAQFRNMLLRRADFEAIDVQPDDSDPMLLVGAVDVMSGEFRTFNSRRERISVDALLASAAIPTLFRSVQAGGGTYWDGLFSQNPPVRELIDATPDEIWVIQVNPKERDAEPKSMVEIADRRNELAGNLSLHQELHFIEAVDRMIDSGALATNGKYRPIVVRVIELARSALSPYIGTASKLNRDPAFIRGLIAHGEARAEEFLVALAFEDAWRSRDAEAIMGFFDEGSELVSAPRFPEHGPARGLNAIRAFVVDHLVPDLALDLNRKQVTGERGRLDGRPERPRRVAATRGTRRGRVPRGPGRRPSPDGRDDGAGLTPRQRFAWLSAQSSA